jgi:Na+-translocating ferredoxin:NAD+ oxidoreductase RnfG subunit
MPIARLLALISSRNGLIAIAAAALVGGVFTWDHNRIARVRIAERKSTISQVNKATGVTNDKARKAADKAAAVIDPVAELDRSYCRDCP